MGPRHTSQNVLITGGTGFVGKAVLARLADVPRYGRIFLVVRPSRGVSPEDRCREVIARMFPGGRLEEMLARVVAVPGDLTKLGFGVSKETLDMLRKDVDQLLHVGASTDFGAPLDESRLHNVEGTRHALQLAIDLHENGRLKRFDYVSTAYVAGRLRGVVKEADLQRGQPFSNNYEQSKYEAELLVRSYAKRLPTAIYRPSIIVGDSNNGHTPHFKVLYWPLQLLSKNLLPFFSCNPRARLDVVPVDYVADAIVALMQRDASLNETFHLTAGLGREIRIRDVLRDSYRYAGIKPRPLVSFPIFNLIWRTPLKKLFHDSFWGAAELARPYFRYLKGNGVRFDASKTDAVLAPLGVTCPNWNDYKREVLGYCIASRWGRKPPLPEYVYYLPVSGRKEMWRELAHDVPQPESANLNVAVSSNA